VRNQNPGDVVEVDAATDEFRDVGVLGFYRPTVLVTVPILAFTKSHQLFRVAGLD